MTRAITVVIPTHNRRDSVMRLLRALDRQQPIGGGFEVFVVADGCTDETVQSIRDARWTFDIAVVEQPASGPAAARNRGAARGSGPILLFLDDDVEPLPNALRAHAAFHGQCADRVAIGDLPPLIAASGYYGTCLRGWWLGMYDGARQQGHRYLYRNLLSGHFSIARAQFDALGGFDEELRCHEDWELGYRAIEAGLRLQYVPEAVAVHHEAATLSKTLRRKYDDGFADVQLIARHPSLAGDVPLGRAPIPGRLARTMRTLAWERPPVGDRIARALLRLLQVYEIARLRFRWRALLENLFDYAYWRGVASAAGSREALGALLDRGPEPQPPETVIDLARGLDAAKAELDARRPRSARLMVGANHVADVPAVAGAERLRGEHLPRIIARQFAREYLRAAAAAGIIPAPLRADPRVLASQDERRAAIAS